MADFIIASPPLRDSPLARLLIDTGRTTGIEAERAIPLDAEDVVWFIEQGKADIFAVARQNAELAARRYLGTFEAGELIFCAAIGQPLLQTHSDKCDAPSLQWQLVIVPQSETRLMRLDGPVFEQLASNRDNIDVIEEGVLIWGRKLQALLSRDPAPQDSISVFAGEQLRLPDDLRCLQVGGGVIWLAQLEGQSNLFGLEGLGLPAEGRPAPLAAGCWLNAIPGAAFACSSTQQALEGGQFWKGIAWLQAVVLRETSRKAARQLQSEMARTQQRIENDIETFRSANSQLASTLKSGGLYNIVRSSAALPRPKSHADKTHAAAVSKQKIALGPRPARTKQAQEEKPAALDPLSETCRLIAERLGVDVRFPAGTQRETPVLQRLQQICDLSQWYSRKVMLRGKWWRYDNGPLVGFRKSSPVEDTAGLGNSLEPVALLPASATSYELVDPRAGTREAINPETEKLLHESAFVVYPTSSEAVVTLRDFFVLLSRRHWRDLAAIIPLALASGLLAMLLPVIAGTVYGAIIPEQDRLQLAQLIMVLFAAALGACAFQIIRALSLLRLTGKLDLHLQPLLWARLLALPISFFRRFTVGDLTERLQGIGTIRQLLLADVTSTILALITSLTSFGLLFYYSWRAALLASGLLLCFACATAGLAVFQSKHHHRSLEMRGIISGLAFSFVDGIAKLRSSGAEIRAYGIWANKYAQCTRHAFQAQRMSSLQMSMNALYIVASELAIFAVVGFGLHHQLSLSNFLAFSIAFGQVQAALLTFTSLTPDLLAIAPIYRRLQPIFMEPPEADDNKDPIELTGDLEVRHVSFCYEEQGPLVLDNVSFQAKRGEFIAIVGPSGSGKSTLVRLLLGFERPKSGSIFYDQRDLGSLDLKSVRRQIGTVLQNSRPIPGDIFSNIVGGTGHDLDAAWEAARIAGIDEEIRAMPMGIHTPVGDGATTFSGGEQQRLMIARAVVNRPQVMLLDEATSALDNPTQDKVQRCLERLNVTRIVVAHRLSTIRRADRIYVLDRGRIIEEGTYEDLWKRGGYFAKMARWQI